MGYTQAGTVGKILQADLFVDVCVHELNNASKDMRSHAPLPGIGLGATVLKEVMSKLAKAVSMQSTNSFPVE